MSVVVAVVLAVVLLGAAVTWTAARADRLHGRAATTAAALDAQLVRRAAASAALADAGREDLGAHHAEVLASAASFARSVGPDRREVAEEALSRALRGALHAVPVAALRREPLRTLVADVDEAARRAALARRFAGEAHRAAAGRRARPLLGLLPGSRGELVASFEVDEDLLADPLAGRRDAVLGAAAASDLPSTTGPPAAAVPSPGRSRDPAGGRQ